MYRKIMGFALALMALITYGVSEIRELRYENDRLRKELEERKSNEQK